MGGGGRGGFKVESLLILIAASKCICLQVCNLYRCHMHKALKV